MISYIKRKLVPLRYFWHVELLNRPVFTFGKMIPYVEGDVVKISGAKGRHRAKIVLRYEDDWGNFIAVFKPLC